MVPQGIPEVIRLSWAASLVQQFVGFEATPGVLAKSTEKAVGATET